jgi:hypothetical protein
LAEIFDLVFPRTHHITISATTSSPDSRPSPSSFRRQVMASNPAGQDGAQKGVV